MDEKKGDKRKSAGGFARRDIRSNYLSSRTVIAKHDNGTIRLDTKEGKTMTYKSSVFVPDALIAMETVQGDTRHVAYPVKKP